MDAALVMSIRNIFSIQTGSPMSKLTIEIMKITNLQPLPLIVVVLVLVLVVVELELEQEIIHKLY